MIEFIRAPVFATVQDGGRDGFRRSGVPPGGAMDMVSLFAGNALLGNDFSAAAVEWALTGGELRFHAPLTFALTGATALARLNDTPLQRGIPITANPGDTLVVDRIDRGRFLYLCVSGGISVPRVLGGSGTYLPAGFGGLEGRRLRDGDRLHAGAVHVAPAGPGSLPADADVLADDRPIGLLRGPQAELLSDSEWHSLLAGELTVAPESDRAGFRLNGAQLGSIHSAAEKSEPACVGAVQLTPSGTLIVLMPDGPTVGGYAKVAVVATADLPRLAQCGAGARVRLRELGTDEARAELRAQRDLLNAISALTRAAERG